MRTVALTLAFGAALLACSANAQAPGSVTLVGLDPARTKTVGLAEFDALPHVMLTVMARGKPRTYEGFSLLELMRQVGGPWGDTLTGKQMDQVLLVTCADGYKVAYSIGEADPGTAKGQILLIDKIDGAPLDAKAGPFETVVENDLRPARSAHQVIKVQLVELK